MFAAQGNDMTQLGGFAAGLCKEIEISLAGRNLPDLDYLSKSDPMVVVYIQPFGHNQWQEFSRTEVIVNSRNPDFTKKIVMMFRFEEQQKLKFEIYDVDSTSSDLSRHDFIGWVEITLGNLVSQHVIQKKIEYHNPRLNRGTLIVSAEELSSNKEEVEIQLVAHGLDKKDFFGKSDPFVIISKSVESGGYVAVHKTEVIKTTLNPVWKSFTIPVRNLNNGDYERTLKLECWDWNRSGSHSFIGEAFFSLQKLIEGPLPMTLFCMNPEMQKKKKNYKNSGRFEFVHCKINPVYTFLDYLQGGTEINCTIAIDFTASNGDPNTPSSLHYLGGGPTLYEQALSAVGEIVEDYDSDKQFPVIGFGARLPPIGRVSHEFHVNFNPTNPYCDRVPGIIAAYRSCLSLVQLYGPTNFAPCIRHVTKFAQEYQDGSHYFILLILTDGIITDMYDTKEAIVDASSLPLSIIIVGIGNADFTAMDELDSDATVLTAPSGRKAQRDIVQFVPFSQFLNANMNPALGRLHLAREILREIPDQFIGYMKSRKISPKPPRYDLSRLPPDPNLS
ncbi:copine-8-like isoform X1 [Daphnia carinata]|uniref:copine-8-like isoform X1 n=1 Tax=Daphnia carinata TaxID=120202 RepID=UPI00257C7A1C|nr:copine-8-like isoform X1 [Daphnia carinata]XP_057372381.1 copine-8-like isoform X1 [Daphnia carinata]XP_057372382.1 copine-8-like isoform X1 [Daphnia carinata]